MSEENKLKDFIQGQQDCFDGLHPKLNQSVSYYKGYSFQYELEQRADERTKWRVSK